MARTIKEWRELIDSEFPEYVEGDVLSLDCLGDEAISDQARGYYPDTCSADDLDVFDAYGFVDTFGAHVKAVAHAQERQAEHLLYALRDELRFATTVQQIETVVQYAELAQACMPLNSHPMSLRIRMDVKKARRRVDQGIVWSAPGIRFPVRMSNSSGSYTALATSKGSYRHYVKQGLRPVA